MKVLKIKSMVFDESKDREPLAIDGYKLDRILPSKKIPADDIPTMVDDALKLLRPLLIKLYNKHRND